MQAIKRVVSTDFWEDEKVINLFTPEDKLFMLYLLTNPHTTQLGIYKLVPKIAGFELGYSTESVVSLLDRFENRYKIIKYSPETSEVAIKNFLKHSIIKGGKPVLDCLIKEEAKVKDKSLLEYIYDGISNTDNLNITVKDYILHLESIVNNNNNDNDNDNERIVDESSRPRELKRFNPPTAEEVDAYCIEKQLTHVNPYSFVEFYGSKNWMIGKNKMSNWHMAVSGWNRRAIERGEREYIREKKAAKTDTRLHPDRPKRFDTAPEETWLKLKPYVYEDGNFNWMDFDSSVLTESDSQWMRDNNM